MVLKPPHGVLVVLGPVWGEFFGHIVLQVLRDEPNVIDIRNIGMIGAVELAPSDAGPSKRAYEVFLDCWRNNVMVRFTGDTIAMSPPLIMTEDNIEQLVETLRAAIRRAA